MSEKKGNRLKLFLENFLIYGLSSGLQKLVPVIMLPIMARLLPNTSDYGVIDLYSTIVAFGVTLGGLGMYDSVFRFFFEKDDVTYRKSLLVTGGSISFAFTVFLVLILLFGRGPLSLIFFADRQYENLIVLAAINILINVLAGIFIWPIRMENKRKVNVLSHFIFSILTYFITVWLLLRGLTYMAVPISGIMIHLLSCLFYLIYGGKWFFSIKFNKAVIKGLLNIGIPTVFNLLIYWVFNSSDRIMISNMLGNDANGVYAIGSKVASVSQFIYMAFAGGWSYFAFSTMKSDDQIETASNILQWLGAISFFAYGLICLVYKSIFSLFFQGEYVQGYIVFPYLFLSPLILMLFQVAGSQLIIFKKAYWNTTALIGGVIANIVLNLLLIPRYGIKGAALATLIGYLISISAIMLIANRQKMLNISRNFMICYLFAIFLSVHIFMWDNIWSLFFSVSLSATTLFLYMGDLSRFFKIALNAVKRKRT